MSSNLPTKGEIKVNLGDTFDNIQVRVINGMGLLHSQNKYTNTKELEVRLDGEKGVYLIEVISTKGSTTARSVFNVLKH